MALYSGDLKGTVSDLVSIDEYKPKTGVDNEIIVVAFYAIDEAPAKDVDSFLERSSLEIIDVEVSPNPNEDGFYVIFVEMYRDKTFPDQLLLLMKEMDRITGGMEWKISPYLADNTFDISDNAWKKHVIFDKDAYMSKEEYKNKKNTIPTKESIHAFFKNSQLKTIVESNGKYQICGLSGVITLDLTDLCDEETLTERHDFKNTPILWEKTYPLATALRVMLGEGWNVVNHSDSILIMNTWDKNIMYGKICL